MLTSITPLGERGRMRRWSATTAWYITGSTLGGALLGAAAGALGAALGRTGLSTFVAALLAAAACLLAAVSDSRGVRPPSWRRQVDENWLGRYRGWVIGGGFGLQLGVGLATIVSTAALYAALLLALLTESFWGGLAIGLTFGLARALPLLAVRQVRTHDALAGLHRRVATLAPRAQAGTVGVLAAATFGLIAAALAS